MESTDLESILERKAEMRREAYDRRAAQEDKKAVSQQAVERFLALDEFQSAKNIMWYIHCRSETRTKKRLEEEVNRKEKTIIVPYCTEDENGENKLGLWKLENMDEMVVGKWNILEPPRERWGEPGKEIPAEELDLVIVPGVAFSRTGGRMGNGQGFYDRLLQHVRLNCPLIALCYESQLFDNLIVGRMMCLWIRWLRSPLSTKGRGDASLFGPRPGTPGR